MTKRTSPYSPTYNRIDLTSFQTKAISRIDFTTVDNQQPKQVSRLIKNSEKNQKQEEEGNNQQLANKKIAFEESEKENQTPSVLNQTKASSFSLTLSSKVDIIADNNLNDMMIGNTLSTRSISPPKKYGFENEMPHLRIQLVML